MTTPGHFYLPDARVRPFRLEQATDLTAADVLRSGEDYVVFKTSVPPGQVLVVKSFVCYLQQRITPTVEQAAVNIGEDTPEQLRLMPNTWIAGQVSFEPLVNGASPVQFSTDNAQRFPAATAQNTQRSKGKGVTSVSIQPDIDLAANWWNPLFSFVVRAGQTLQFNFRLLEPGAGVTAIAIDATPTDDYHVDYAGVIVAGQILSENDYTAFLAKEGRI